MIDDDALKAATAKLLFESFTEEDRAKMITDAIKQLLTQQANTNVYSSDKRTHLQVKFDDAIRAQASILVTEYIRTPAVLDQLRAAIVAAFDKALSGDFAEQFAARMTNGLFRND